MHRVTWEVIMLLEDGNSSLWWDDEIAWMEILQTFKTFRDNGLMTRDGLKIPRYETKK